MIPIFRFDSQSRISWLEFDGKPEQATIDLLKSEGWRWSGYRKQWHTNKRFVQVPAGIEYEDGGECDYSSERPDRLKHAAVRAGERSESAYEHSNALVDGIPFGQPIIVGGCNQHTHEKTLERSRSAMDKSVEEGKKAEHLEYKAKSSARHQAYKERPDVIARRIKRLKGEITSYKNNLAYNIRDIAWDVKEGRISEEEGKQKLEACKQAIDARITLIEAEIKENEQALAEAGGLIADRVAIEIGDVIKAGWRGLCEVKKINTRKGEIMSYTCTPLENTWHDKYVVPKDEVYGMALRKGEVTSEAVLQAKLEARHGHTYQVQPELEKKEFKVQAVETVEVYDNRTSLFPTPTALADQLAQHIPHDAYLILEPSAGTGSLVGAVTRLLMERGQNHMTHCCELLPKLRYSLIQRGYKVVGEDFMQYTSEMLYDAIIANPPFKGTEWLDHIEHMLELLKPGGTLLAIVPSGFSFREDKRVKAFREMVEEHGWHQELPEDSFVESGTSVHTVMLVMRIPEEKKPESVQPIEAIQSISLW